MDSQLTFRAPFDGDGLIAFLGTRAVAGIEEVAGGAYRRSLRLAGGAATVELRAGSGCVHARFRLAGETDLPAAEAAVRRLLDLDADPAAVISTLGRDRLLGPVALANPGRRVPGHVDADELAIRAMIGQQVSVAGARTVTGRLVAAYGEPLSEALGSITHLFPTSATLAEIPAEELSMPRARARALTGLARALAEGVLVLDPGADLDSTRAGLLSLSGIGPWTAAYIEMRALGNRDAFLATDLGVRRALERLGEDGSPRAAIACGERWRPYRAYAVHHLWSTLN